MNHLKFHQKLNGQNRFLGNKFAANLVNQTSLEVFCNGEYESGKDYSKHFSFFNPLEAEHGSKMT